MDTNRVKITLIVILVLHPLIMPLLLYSTALVFKVSFGIWPQYGDARFLNMQSILYGMQMNTLILGIFFLPFFIYKTIFASVMKIRKLSCIYFLTYSSFLLLEKYDPNGFFIWLE